MEDAAKKDADKKEAAKAKESEGALLEAKPLPVPALLSRPPMRSLTQVFRAGVGKYLNPKAAPGSLPIAARCTAELGQLATTTQRSPNPASLPNAPRSPGSSRTLVRGDLACNGRQDSYWVGTRPSRSARISSCASSRSVLKSASA